MWYSFWRDDHPTISIEQVGGYDFYGNKKDVKSVEFGISKFRAKLEFDFSYSMQDDGHGPADGDFKRDFAETVLSCLIEKIKKEDFVKAYKQVIDEHDKAYMESITK